MPLMLKETTLVDLMEHKSLNLVLLEFLFNASVTSTNIDAQLSLIKLLNI